MSITLNHKQQEALGKPAFAQDEKRRVLVKANVLQVTTNLLRSLADRHGFLDVGKNSAAALGISRLTMEKAVSTLYEEGYRSFYLSIDPVAPDKTRVVGYVRPTTGTVKVLTKPGTTFLDTLRNKDNIHPVETTTQMRKRILDEREKELSRKTLRIRQLKRGGASNVAIGKMLGINESTVRRRLKAPLTPDEIMKEKLSDIMSEARDLINERLTELPEFAEMVGEDSDSWVLRISTYRKQIEINRDDKKITFDLKFAARVKEEEKRDS